MGHFRSRRLRDRIVRLKKGQVYLRHTDLPLTVASFRIWRGSQILVAQGLAPYSEPQRSEVSGRRLNSDLWKNGGEERIRTSGTLRYTHFPGVLLRPARTPLRIILNPCIPQGQPNRKQKIPSRTSIVNGGLFNSHQHSEVSGKMYPKNAHPEPSQRMITL